MNVGFIKIEVAVKENRKLLEKFLDGLCTEEELREVNFLLASKEGRNQLDTLIEERETAGWNNSSERDSSMKELVEQKQAEMQCRIEEHESHRLFHNKFIRWGSYAAAFIGVFIMINLLVIQNTSKEGLADVETQYAEINNPTGLPILHILPDNTRVYLAAGSTLKYPEVFSKTGRDIELQGEAFFDVTHDESRPFTIHSGTMSTRVLGTSFKVTAFAGQEQEVAVATGKVRVSTKGENNKSKAVLLTRGLKVNYNPQTGVTTTGNIDVHSLEEWKTGTLYINEQPMSLVAKQLEGRYGIRLVFVGTEAARQRVSGTFTPNEHVSEILDMLGIVGKFRHESSDGKNYTIY